MARIEKQLYHCQYCGKNYFAYLERECCAECEKEPYQGLIGTPAIRKYHADMLYEGWDK